MTLALGESLALVIRRRLRAWAVAWREGVVTRSTYPRTRASAWVLSLLWSALVGDRRGVAIKSPPVKGGGIGKLPCARPWGGR